MLSVQRKELILKKNKNVGTTHILHNTKQVNGDVPNKK
jgi:hypothetical protein